jgi:mitochondrial intermembrane space import and assembly protein 40
MVLHENLNEISENKDFDFNESINQNGEINWDCPCLKEALEPPCGDAFKLAFSCYFNSKTSPKGSDCVKLFEDMQKCYEINRELYYKKYKDFDNQQMDP